jgi:hypothetical protein
MLTQPAEASLWAGLTAVNGVPIVVDGGYRDC